MGCRQDICKLYEALDSIRSKEEMALTGFDDKEISEILDFIKEEIKRIKKNVAPKNSDNVHTAILRIAQLGQLEHLEKQLKQLK